MRRKVRNPWLLMCRVNEVAMTFAQYVINAGPGPKLISTTNVKTSPIEITIEGICGRLKLIAATEKDARLRRIQGSPYSAGKAEKETIAIGIETRQITMRYNLQRSGKSFQ